MAESTREQQVVITPGPSGILVFPLGEARQAFVRAVHAQGLFDVIEAVEARLRNAILVSSNPQTRAKLEEVRKIIDDELVAAGVKDLFS